MSYECAVAKSGYFGTTVWRGSAIDCPGGEINLLHRLYNDTETHISIHAYGECSNGSIVAQGVRIENGTYISQLNVSVSTDMIGRSIQCFEDTTYSTLLVGSAIISTSGKDSYIINSLATLENYVIIILYDLWHHHCRILPTTKYQ